MPEPQVRAFHVGLGEEAAVTDGPPARGEVRSRGYLPLRVRTEGVPYRRPAFCGTALVLGDSTYEVVRETASEEGVVYALRPWPEGEVIRDLVVYGPRLVRAAQADRERAATQVRLRPYRFVLYPLVGFLPENEQGRLAHKLGLYTVTATMASGLVELALPLIAVWQITRGADEGLRLVTAIVSPALSLIAVGGFSRAFAAWAFRETSGSYLVEMAFAAVKGLRHAAAKRDATLVPLTRDAFWARLEIPDTIEPQADGVLVFRGLLPHLTWRTGHRVRAHDDYWLVEALPPALERGRLVYAYRLALEASSPTAPREAPAADAYAAEVKAGIRREWDDLLGSFSWLASLLSSPVQGRAFGDFGGPAAARRSTWTTALAGLVFGGYVLLQPHEAGDPVGPWLRATAFLLLIDGVVRIVRAERGHYAPSVFRFALPSDSLRPERLAYHAHRDRGQVLNFEASPEGSAEQLDLAPRSRGANREL
jgi:hypothetical protein